MPSSRKHREVHKTKLNNTNNEIVHLKGTVQKLVNVVSDIKYETTNTKETFLFPVIQHYKAILMLFVDFADDLTITHPYNELIISVFY